MFLAVWLSEYLALIIGPVVRPHCLLIQTLQQDPASSVSHKPRYLPRESALRQTQKLQFEFRATICKLLYLGSWNLSPPQFMVAMHTSPEDFKDGFPILWHGANILQMLATVIPAQSYRSSCTIPVSDPSYTELSLFPLCSLNVFHS